VNEATWPPCIDCGAPEAGTCPGQRCRDCDLEFIVATSTCRECLQWMMREDVAGPLRDQHAPECSLRDAEDYHARDDAELRAVRERRYGWAP